MLLQIFLMVLDTAFSLLSIALLARFVMQWARVPFRNPIGQFLVAVTDWAVRPARRIIPSAWGLDLPSVLLAWLAQCIYLGLAYGLTAGPFAHFGAIGTIALIAVLETVKLALHLALGILIVGVVISWVNPYAPMAPLFKMLSEPMLRPFQRVIPPIGGVDLSPMIPFLLIQIALMLLASLRSSLLFL